MLFDIPFLANSNKVEEHGQRQTDRNTERENRSHRVWDHKIGDKVLLTKDGSSTKVKVGMKVILGLSHQFIQMGLSGFNVEQNLND